MPPRQARGRVRSLTRAQGARVDREEGDGENHQEANKAGSCFFYLCKR